MFISNQRETQNLPPTRSGIRELTDEEICFVSGGDASSDALACALSGLAALEAPSVGTIGIAVGLCGVAAQSAPVSANCTPDNACVDGSVDGSDGIGSVGGSDGGDSAGGGDSTD